ncbi:MAG: LysE family translocator [Francisellaceae bacterium]|jgi:L-lysine exporter family protein LysE/ArgO|nr:LysE family translocator [Francisellaceae bacterium]MBT6539059.1 LysE family translocator [Francisellaceae bacterium]
MITEISEKLLLGIALAAPPGPVTVEMIKRGLNKGFFAAFNIRLGGAIGNSICLIAAFFGLSVLQSYPRWLDLLGILGAIFIIYLGLTTLKNKIDKKIFASLDSDGVTGGALKSLWIGLMLAVVNPVALVFWLGIYAATVDTQAASVDFRGLWFNFFIIAGVLLWGAFLSGLLEGGRRILNEKSISLISIFAGILLVGYGLKYGLTILSGLIS